MMDRTTLKWPTMARLGSLLRWWAASVVLGCGVAPQGSFISPSASYKRSLLSDHIVVVSSLSQAVVLLGPDGRFVRELLVLDGSTTDAPTGVTLYDIETLLVAVDGVDRILSVSLTEESPNPQTFAIDSNLTGNLGGVARLASGDILVAESNNVERLTGSGFRVTSGGWPKALQTALTGIVALSDGGFVACSTTTDAIRSYDEDGVQLSTAVSGIAGTTDVRDCTVGADGRVAAVFAGTTDTIRIYQDSDLSTVLCDFSDVGLLGDPRAATFRPNGHLLIADGTRNVLVEINSDCELERVYSSSSLATAVDLLVIP